MTKKRTAVPSVDGPPSRVYSLPVQTPGLSLVDFIDANRAEIVTRIEEIQSDVVFARYISDRQALCAEVRQLMIARDVLVAIRQRITGPAAT